MRKSVILPAILLLLAAGCSAAKTSAPTTGTRAKTVATTNVAPTTLPIVTVPSTPTSGPPSAAAPSGKILMVKLYVGNLARGEKFYGAVFGAKLAVKIGAFAHVLTFANGGPGLILIRGGPGDKNKKGSFLIEVPSLKAAKSLDSFDSASGPPLSPSAAQTPGQLPTQLASSLDEQAFVDRLVAHPHHRIVGILKTQALGDLLGPPPSRTVPKFNTALQALRVVRPHSPSTFSTHGATRLRSCSWGRPAVAVELCWRSTVALSASLPRCRAIRAQTQADQAGQMNRRRPCPPVKPVGANNFIHVTPPGDTRGSLRRADSPAGIVRRRHSLVSLGLFPSATAAADRATDEAGGRCSARRTRVRRLRGGVGRR